MLRVIAGPNVIAPAFESRMPAVVVRSRLIAAVCVMQADAAATTAIALEVGLFVGGSFTRIVSAPSQSRGAGISSVHSWAAGHVNAGDSDAEIWSRGFAHDFWIGPEHIVRVFSGSVAVPQSITEVYFVVDDGLTAERQ
jgi:hypothetical protein